MDWKQLSDREWARRLSAAQATILEFVAAHGINIHAGENTIGGIVLEDFGASLVPSLKIGADELDAHVKALGDPALKLDADDAHEHLSERIFGYAMSAAEAGFLLGVLAGCHLSPSVVSRMPAPSVPVKGGAR